MPMSMQAMKAGAVEFLTKPFSDQELLDAIDQAIERDPAWPAPAAQQAELRAVSLAELVRMDEGLGISNT
jgi:FixJ family two-component response regulator